MKSIFKIHLITYIVALIFILLGDFKLYISFMIVLIIHELGHITFAYLFKWHIKKIIVLPLGLLLKFEDNLNKPLIEEFIISIMGVVYQLIFITIIHNDYLIISSNIILIFNLIPIYPLDGSKIINIILNKITNFKTSYFLTLLLSFIVIIILISISFIYKSLIFLISLIPLLINLNYLILSREKVYIKFVLERYLYNFKFKKKKIIRNINKLKRDYYHYIIVNGKISSEDEYLKKLFRKKT